MASVDWSKYGGVSEDTPAKRKSLTSIDWSRYGTTEQPKYGYSMTDRSAAQPYRPDENEVEEPRKGFVGRVLDAGQSVVDTVNAFNDAGANALTFGLHNRLLKSTGNTERLENQRGFAGGVGRFTGEAIGVGKAYNLASRALKPITTRLPNLVDRAVRPVASRISPTTGALTRVGAQNVGKGAGLAATGALGTSMYQTAVEGGEEAFGVNDQTLRQRVGDIGEAAAFGLIFDPVADGLIGSIGSMLRRRGIPEETVGEVLALPEPRQRGNANSVETPNVIIDADTRPLGLPEPSIAPPTTARISRQANPYRQQFESLVERARQLQSEGKFTPGREDEELRSLWSQMAGPDGVSLDELIDLAYQPRPSRVSPDLVHRARQNQAAREVAGAPMPVRSFADRYQQGVVAPAARPVERIVRTEQETPTVAPAQNDVPIVSPRLAEQDFEVFDPKQLKDISSFNAQTRDVYRNFEKVLGPETARPYLDEFNRAKAENIDMQEYWLNRLKTEVVDRLGIKKDSKLSALVQMYGEKKIDIAQLKQRAPKDWEKVVEADKWFREAYDNLIDIVNDSRARIYPNNPDKIVPKRSDYYRHFRELNGLEGLKNLFETPAGIDPQLVGTSEFTSPKSKFAGFMQRRGLGPYKNDAVGGFLNYIPAASYATHIDPQVSLIRSLQNALAGTTGETKNLNNFIEFLHDFANDLSGKTNAADRYLQKIVPGGRKTMGVLNWVNNRVKTNTILGNVGSVLAQTANIPNGIAFAKQYAIPGFVKTVESAFKPNPAAAKSGFLKERFVGKHYRQFDQKWLTLSNPLHLRKMAEWTMETADRLGTTFVWNSAYAKGVAEKVKNPIAYADDATRKLIGGRGVGEQPLFLKSNIGKIVAPFQLEVANLWRVMGDFVSKKDFTGLAILFTANWLFNRAMEQVRGSGVTFDPIQAIIEASEEGLAPEERAGRVAGEVLSNLPLGQTAAALMPEYGGEAFGVEIPTREELFGDNDPTRFGTGIPAVKGVQQPLYNLVPGFGGNQIRKTVQGVQTLREGDATTKDGDIKFPVAETPQNVARTLLFGPNSTPEAREYYDNKRRPLGANDSETYRSMDDQSASEFYKSKMRERSVNRIKDQMKEVRQDDNLSTEQKGKKLADLQRKLDELVQDAG